MQNKIGRYTLLIVCAIWLSLIASTNAQSPTINEELIRRELKDKGIDEMELVKRLEEKGIDIQNLDNKSEVD